MSEPYLKEVEIGSLLTRRSERGHNDDPLLSVTQDKGLIPQETAGRRNISSKEKGTYWRVYPDDLVYNTMRMWQGASARSQYFGIVSPAYTVCHPVEGVSSAYLGYVLKLPENVTRFCARSQGITSDVWNLRFKEFRKIRVDVVTNENARRKIADILATVDEAIKQTEDLIAKTQQIKAGLMYDLFTRGVTADGHLRPPRREAPQLYKQSPLGWIPKEWEVTEIACFADLVTSGSRGWAEYYAKEGAAFIRIGNLTRSHPNLRYDNLIHVQPPASSEGQRTRLLEGDLLISITADLGITAVIPKGLGEAYINQHIALVRLKDPDKDSRWLGHFLGGWIAQSIFRLLDDPGAKAGLNLPTIRSFPIVLPSVNERKGIVKLLDTIDQKIAVEEKKSEKLLLLKSALMHDLLTGCIRVPVA